MVDEHFPREVLEKFIKLDISRAEALAVVRHLLARCPQCAEGVAAAVAESPEEAELWGTARGADYEQVFERVLRRVEEAEARLTAERQRATEQWVMLEGHPQARRLVMVHNDERLQTWGLYERLLEASRKAGARHPAAAVEIAELALAVLDHLDPSEYGRERLADFRAAALGVLANAKRLARDLEGAQAAFYQAWRELARGTDDPLDEAMLLCLEASLLCDLGEFEAAVELVGGMGAEAPTGLLSRSGTRTRGDSAPRRARWIRTSTV